MKQTDSVFSLFVDAVGEKLREVSGVEDTFYERCRNVGFPRICYTATVWTSADALRGTLSCTISVNGQPSDADCIAHTLLQELEGFCCCSDELTYYLHDGRIAPSEDSDKKVFIRILTFEFFAMGG